MSARVAPPSPPYLGPAKFHGGPQAGPFTRIVVHCTVSPTERGGARTVARYFRETVTRPSSAHYVVDPFESVQVVGDHTVAYHAPPNENTIGVELCDPQAGPPARWRDELHDAMLRRAARLIARLCLAYGVPVEKLTPADLLAGRRGICGHADVTNAWHQTSHTDPGLGFPWLRFMGLVHAAAEKLRTDQAAGLVVGTWNVERDHSPNAHALNIVNVFEAQRLDVLALQETHDYARFLRVIAKDRGHQLVMFDEKPGHDQQMLLLRAGREVERSWNFRAGGGWVTVDGLDHAPVYPAAAVVDGIVFVSTHAPVTVNWRAGVPYGPPRRVAAYLAHTKRLVKVFEQHQGRPVVALGDWNATPADRGVGTPNALAKRAHADLVAPPGGTHGTSSKPIDYAIARDVVAAHVTAGGKYGSDHRLVRLRVRAR